MTNLSAVVFLVCVGCVFSMVIDQNVGSENHDTLVLHEAELPKRLIQKRAVFQESLLPSEPSEHRRVRRQFGYGSWGYAPFGLGGGFDINTPIGSLGWNSGFGIW
uniref:Secreted protein n=1 Tax=Haemonchus contortus TaxID=6289 RepID=A0A7I4Y0H2_HAECO